MLLVREQVDPRTKPVRHLLESGYDIGTVYELLGHRTVLSPSTRLRVDSVDRTSRQ